MQHSSVRNLLVAVVAAAQLLIISGCMSPNEAAEADKYVRAVDKRMKQIEKDAVNVNSKRNSDSTESKGEGE